MMNNEFVSFKGIDTELNDFLSEYYEASQIDMVRKSMPLLNSSLSDSETISKSHEPDSDGEKVMGLIVMDYYFINVKKTTLALLGLVLDIKFTKGFATFVMAEFGITSEKIRKLSEDEKQIILLINAEKILIDTENNVYEINDERDYGYSSKEIKDIVDKLVEDEVVIRKGRSLKIAF